MCLQAVSGAIGSELTSGLNPVWIPLATTCNSSALTWVFAVYPGTLLDKKWWQEVRVYILRKKYTNELSNLVKFSQASYQSTRLVNFRVSRPVFEFLVSLLLSGSLGVT